jgi:hypothetical protein
VKNAKDLIIRNKAIEKDVILNLNEKMLISNIVMLSDTIDEVILKLASTIVQDVGNKNET